MFRFFETLVPRALAPPKGTEGRGPPPDLLGFYWHLVRQTRGLYLAMLATSLAVALLDTLMQGKTVIAIAHRLSTIARMHRLVLIDAGRIVEQGTHGELLASGGLYASLWHRQSGGFLAIGPDSRDAQTIPAIG